MAAKQSKKQSTDLAWHADFRNTESLPDVKVVRTDFLINFVAIFVFIALLSLFGYRQFNAANLKSRIADLQAEVSKQKPANQRNLRESRQFKNSQDIIEDLNNFYATAVPPLDFIVQITEERPKFIAFSKIDFRVTSENISKNKTIEYGVFIISGMLRGSTARDLEDLNSYRDKIGEMALLNDKIDRITVPPPRRDPTLDLYQFNIEIRLKPRDKG